MIGCIPTKARVLETNSPKYLLMGFRGRAFGNQLGLDKEIWAKSLDRLNGKGKGLGIYRGISLISIAMMSKAT